MLRCRSMAKRKTKTSPPDIRSLYMKYRLEHGKRPASEYAFAEGIGISEAAFYEQYSSFEALEKSVFQAFFDHTQQLLQQNEEYHSFDPQNKLLSFYFTFFEVLKANRSYVLLALDTEPNKWKALLVLSGLRKSFQQYIHELNIDTPGLGHSKLETIKDKGIKEASWSQLLFILRFWLDDESAGFEKTDVLIEKSVTTGFALLDRSTLHSVLDLGKFLLKEKIMTH